MLSYSTILSLIKQNSANNTKFKDATLGMTASGYPTGLSVSHVLSTAGWPSDGILTTAKYDDNSIVQWLYNGDPHTAKYRTWTESTFLSDPINPNETLDTERWSVPLVANTAGRVYTGNDWLSYNVPLTGDFTYDVDYYFTQGYNTNTGIFRFEMTIGADVFLYEQLQGTIGLNRFYVNGGVVWSDSVKSRSAYIKTYRLGTDFHFELYDNNDDIVLHHIENGVSTEPTSGIRVFTKNGQGTVEVESVNATSNGEEYGGGGWNEWLDYASSASDVTLDDTILSFTASDVQVAIESLDSKPGVVNLSGVVNGSVAGDDVLYVDGVSILNTNTDPTGWNGSDNIVFNIKTGLNDMVQFEMNPSTNVVYYRGWSVSGWSTWKAMNSSESVSFTPTLNILSTNVQDAIEEINDKIASAGHTISDESVDYVDRAKLQFIGNVTVADDVVNDSTVVTFSSSVIGGIIQPKNLEPADNLIGTKQEPTLVASSFTSVTGVPQQSAEWEIFLTTDLVNPVYSQIDVADTSTHNVLPTFLSLGTEYAWRVRYADTDGIISAWSDLTNFTTATGDIVLTPTNIAPVAGTIDMPEIPSLVSSSFDTTGGTDIHEISHWRIRSSTGSYSSPAFDSGFDTHNLTSITLPRTFLLPNTTYYWQVRHKGANFDWSAWSAETSFTTEVDFSVEHIIAHTTYTATSDVTVFDYNKLIVQEGDNLSYELVLPADIGTYYHSCAAISPEKDHVIMSWSAAPWVRVMKRVGGSLVDGPTMDIPPTNRVHEIKYSLNGQYLVMAMWNGAGINVYKRVGETYVYLINFPIGAADVSGLAWAPSGEHFAVAYQSSGLHFFTINPVDDVVQDITSNIDFNVINMPSNNYRQTLAWSPAGDLLVVLSTTTPFMHMYTRSGNTLTKLPFSNYPAIETTPLYVAWRPEGNRLLISKDHAYNQLTSYLRTGNTFSLEWNSDDIGNGNCNMGMTKDGEYIGITHANVPYMTLFKWRENSTQLLIQSDTTDGNTTLIDSSEYNRTITGLGGIAHSQTDSKFGGSSIFFDGVDDSIEIAHSSELDLSLGGFTIDFWINPTDTSTLRSLINKREAGFASTGWSLEFYTTANSLAWHTNASARWNGTTPIPAGQWTHVAVERFEFTITVYINGVEIVNFPDGYDYNMDCPLRIGYDVLDPALDRFSGYMDDIRIVSGLAMYRGNFTPPTAPHTTAAAQYVVTSDASSLNLLNPGTSITYE